MKEILERAPKKAGGMFSLFVQNAPAACRAPAAGKIHKMRLTNRDADLKMIMLYRKRPKYVRP
jgi:hypothetical protein